MGAEVMKKCYGVHWWLVTGWVGGDCSWKTRR